MKTRNIKDIIEDLMSTANDDNQEITALQKKNKELASELSEIMRKERTTAFIIVLLLLFVSAFAFITLMSNDNLREDVTQKKELLTKFEEAVKQDSISVHTDQDGNKLTVSGLLDDNLKLMNKISDLEFRVSLYEMQLDNLKARYGIKLIKENNSYYIEAKEVDSAMMLLHSFRDRISYDSVNHQWSITRKIVKVGDKTIQE